MPPTPRATIAPRRRRRTGHRSVPTNHPRPPMAGSRATPHLLRKPPQRRLRRTSEPNAVQPAAAGSNADAGAVSKPVKPGSAKTGIVKAAVKDAASDIVTATDSNHISRSRCVSAGRRRDERNTGRGGRRDCGPRRSDGYRCRAGIAGQHNGTAGDCRGGDCHQHVDCRGVETGHSGGTRRGRSAKARLGTGDTRQPRHQKRRR